MIMNRLKKWLVVCAAAIAAHGVWGLTLGGHNRDWWSVDRFMENEYNISAWYYIPNDYNSYYCVSSYYSEEYGNEYQWLYLPSMLSEGEF